MGIVVFAGWLNNYGCCGVVRGIDGVWCVAAGDIFYSLNKAAVEF